MPEIEGARQAFLKYVLSAINADRRDRGLAPLLSFEDFCVGEYGCPPHLLGLS